MIVCRTKDELMRVPGRLVWVASIRDSKRAEAEATRRGYTAMYWQKRTNRLYGVLPK
jgi:hypothetical protein